MLADRLRLEAGSIDLRRSIVARFSILAIDARSIVSEGLRAYGPVHQDVAKNLDAPTESLAEALEGVLRCMDERTKP